MNKIYISENLIVMFYFIEIFEAFTNLVNFGVVENSEKSIR